VSAHRFKSGDILIGRYEILKYLDAGGMQEVYVAKDRALNRKVVMKTPKAGSSDKRFARGAEMSARVNHPNVAATFDYFETEGTTCLVEEYIQGKDLGKRLAEDYHFMDPALAAHTLHHLARAIHEAHRVDICHRDLKPSNVMTSDDDALSSIKLTDFGIAKLAESKIGDEMDLFNRDDSTLTSSKTLLGAVPYMAPECWNDWKKAGQPSDIWALGCIAYHLLAGDPPFGSGRIAMKNLTLAERDGVKLAKPAWFGLHSSTATLEAELWSLINACIQIDPALRPTAESVVKTCDSFCYAASTRLCGTVGDFPITFAAGGIGNFGFILDATQGKHFFHGSDFFGVEGPKSGQRVAFSEYPGVPRPRSCPVLLLRSS